MDLCGWVGCIYVSRCIWGSVVCGGVYLCGTWIWKWVGEQGGCI